MKNFFRILIAFFAIPILLASCKPVSEKKSEVSDITTEVTVTEEAPATTTESTATEEPPATTDSASTENNPDNPDTPDVEPTEEIRVATFNVQSSLSITEKGDLTAASQIRVDALVKEILSYD